VLDHAIVLPEGAPQLVATLQERGYRCYELPMSEFLKAGGAGNVSPCFCRKERK
jgi:N-dimethylarginine dimethylaminohydrolase